MNETFKTITDAGTLGVLLAVLGGLFYFGMSLVPMFKDFFLDMKTLANSQKDLATKQAVIDAKLDMVLASVAALNSAMVKFGDVATGALVKVSDMVQAEGRETRDDLTATEQRLTQVVRREQPDPPSSKQALRRVQ